MRLAKVGIVGRVLGITLPLLACLLAGCGINDILLEKYPRDVPLVAVSDGLFSTTGRNFFKELCREENVPYVGTNSVGWIRNKSTIKKAHEQKREIILVGYSAGCHQVLLEAKWCNKEGISVHVIYFDPTYLSYLSGEKIPSNVVGIVTYLSERDVFDIIAIGKGREVEASDLGNSNTQYSNHELKGPHIGIFRNNKGRLKREFQKRFRQFRDHWRLAAF